MNNKIELNEENTENLQKLKVNKILYMLLQFFNRKN